MRLMTAIMTVSFCAAAACGGGAAQEPYDGVIAGVGRPAAAAPATRAEQARPAPLASELDVPYSIALLSNARTAPLKTPGRVIVVEAAPDLEELDAEHADLQVAVDPESVGEKRAATKSCNGVVKTRS
jgi:hypothetical protein